MGKHRDYLSWRIDPEDAPEPALQKLDPAFDGIAENAAYRIALYLQPKRSRPLLRDCFLFLISMGGLLFFQGWSGPQIQPFPYMMVGLFFGIPTVPFGPQTLPIALLMDLRTAGISDADFARGLLAASLRRGNRKRAFLMAVVLSALALLLALAATWKSGFLPKGGGPQFWYGAMARDMTALTWGAAAIWGFLLGYPFGDLPGLESLLRSEVLYLNPRALGARRDHLAWLRRGNSSFPTLMGVTLVVMLLGWGMDGLMPDRFAAKMLYIPAVAAGFAASGWLGGVWLARMAPSQYVGYLKMFGLWCRELPASEWYLKKLAEWGK